MKKTKLFIITFFCLYIGGFFLLNLLTPDSEFSELENRKLAPFPSFSMEKLLSGVWSANIETYVTDQFVARDTFVSLKSSSERLLGKQENNNIYIGADDTLISKFPTPDASVIERNVQQLDAFMNSLDVPVYMTLIPTQNDIYAHKLPEHAPIVSEKQMIDSVYQQLENTVDIYSVLQAHQDEYIYYHTDHHWTSLGAYYGYTALCESLGITPVPLEDLTETIVSTTFNGTTFSQSGVRYLPSDSIATYTENAPILIEDETGHKDGMLYEDGFLQKHDKYRYFMGGNHPYVQIPNPESTSGRNLLILKDSYSNALAPFFREHFDNVHLIDLRFTRMSVSDYVKQHQITDVLICYSATNFIAPNNFLFLK